MSKCDKEFNGTYDTSRYAKKTLEDDILAAGKGEFAYEGPNGELIRESDSRLDIWGSGDGNGHYPHYYYNVRGDYGKAPDDRHDD